MKSLINDCIETFFSAFENRSMPMDRFISPSQGDPRLEPILRNVNRRDITLDFEQRMGLYPDDWLAFMTNEGRLYYLPVLMSLSLQDFHDGGDRYSTLDDSILSSILPWYFYTPPHEWKEMVQRDMKHSSRGLDGLSSSLELSFDSNWHFRHGWGKLLLSLDTQEKQALRLYVNRHPYHGSEYPLHVYGIYEILDGRVEIGDFFSWLPNHEKVALVDFINFVTTDCLDTLSKDVVETLYSVRNSIQPDVLR